MILLEREVQDPAKVLEKLEGTWTGQNPFRIIEVKVLIHVAVVK